MTKFIVGTRPIRTMEWKDVKLPGAGRYRQLFKRSQPTNKIVFAGPSCPGQPRFNDGGSAKTGGSPALQDVALRLVPPFPTIGRRLPYLCFLKTKMAVG